VQFDSRLTLKPGKSGHPAANLWITDSYPPTFSFKDDSAARPIGLSLPDNGTVIRVVEFPPPDPAAEAKPLDPAAEARMDPDFMMKVVGDHAAVRGLPVKHPLMHRTRTVDYAVILAGEIDMMLDDAVVHVKAGDVVIQQATNHAWINRGKEPCRILFVLSGHWLQFFGLRCSNPYAGKYSDQSDDQIESNRLADQLGGKQSCRNWVDGHRICHSGWRRSLESHHP
jgi:mannose-6-phosphate isomerase-like protein (cupin superfamily)